MLIHTMINDNNSNSNTDCVDRLLDLKAQSMAATLSYFYLQSVILVGLCTICYLKIEKWLCSSSIFYDQSKKRFLHF